MSVESVIRSLEVDLLKAESELHGLQVEKEKKESEYINMEVIMDNIDYFLKNIEELLLGTPDPMKKAAYFGIIFNMAPTYEEINSQTPKLEQCIALNEIFKQKGYLFAPSVGGKGLEPLTSSV